MPLDVPPHIRSLTPYSPGKPIEEVERELGISDSIKLASNENPLGPSPMALEAVRGALAGLHRYPDGGCHALKQALSRRLGVTPRHLVLGNGSNEVIELAVRAYLRSGEEGIMATPTFVIYRLVVQAAGGTPVEIPLRDGRHDLEAMAERISPRTRLLFIANPNNPTGTMNVESEVTRLLARVPDHVLVVLDEAYAEYVTHPEYPRSLAYLEGPAPLLVLRTFSKIYGLAGLRIGYGVTLPDRVEHLERVRQPFNTNTLAQAAARAALDDAAHVAESRRVTAEGKAYLLRELAALGLGPWPTEANFVYVELPRDGQAVYEALLRKGVIVRPMGPRAIRVTIGLPEENQRFITALAQVLEPDRACEKEKQP